jgi:hypothetical protein
VTEEKILERIRHLLAMAEHPNSNPNEAAIALEKAQAMLLKHNLDRASVITNEAQSPVSSKVGQVDMLFGQRWETELARIIAKANLCKLITTLRLNELHFFGSRDNVTVVVAMFLWVREQLEGMSKRDRREYIKNGGSEVAKTWRVSYMIGAVSIIKERLNKPMTEFSQGEGRALVVYNDKALAEAVFKVYPILGRGRGVSYNPHGAGYGLGRQAGAKVTFAKAKPVGSGALALGSGK